MSISKQISDNFQPSGPRLSFEQDQLQKLHFQPLDSNTSLHQTKPNNHTHQTQIIKMDAVKQLTRRRRSELKLGINRTSFLKTIHRNSLVQKFKNILLLRSYVLSKDHKYLLLQDWWQKYPKGILKNNFDSIVPFIIQGSNTSIVLTLWSLFVNILILWLAPFIVSFQIDEEISKTLLILIILQIFLDIFVVINSPLVLNGENVFDRQTIVKNYFKKHLIIDTIFIINLTICFTNFQAQTIRGMCCLIVIFIAYQKMNQNYESYYQILYLKGQYHYAVDVISLVVVIFTYAHIMACIWHFIGETNQHQSWLIQRNLIHSNIWEKYNSSFYWATMTMSTVGYGDITPTNQIETLAVNLMMILSSCMFGYSISQIGMILKSQYEVKLKYKKSIIVMNAFMKNSQVQVEIQSRIRNYLKYQCETEANENKDDIKKIINELPIGLRSELIQDVQMNIIRKIRILTNQFSQSFLKGLSQCLQEFKFTPDDVIYHINDPDDQSLYYIQEGVVNLIEEKSQKILQQLKSGDFFGEYQFFTGFSSKTQAKSQGFTKIFRLTRQQILPLLNNNTKDFQRFHHIKDNIIYNSNYQIVLKSCNYCNMTTHYNIDCPLLSYKPDVLQRIKKSELHPTIQIRNKRWIRNNEKINSLNLHNAIKDSVEEYKANLSTIDDPEMKLFSTYATRDFQSHISYPSQPTQPPPQTSQFKPPPLKKNQSFLNRQKIINPSQNQNIISNQIQIQSQNVPQKRAGLFLNMKTMHRDSDKQLESEDDQQECNSLKNAAPQIDGYQFLEFQDQFQTTNYNIDRLMNYFGYMPNNNIIQTLRKYEKHHTKYSKVRTLNYPESDRYTVKRESINELLREKD